MCDVVLMRTVLICYRYLENNVGCCVNENCATLLQVPGEQCRMLFNENCAALSQVPRELCAMLY